ncbi:MAG: magnesium transporter [Helicobacteraceae bacterium]|jgi:magnesium transporter|nr:magnesium transporter [Helicobacteraceae bacterium]
MDQDIRAKKEELLKFAAECEKGASALSDPSIHESDIAEALMELKEDDNEADFNRVINALPPSMLGLAVLELPDRIQDDLIRTLDERRWAAIVEELDTDDATDIIQRVEEIDEAKSYEILRLVGVDLKENIENLKRFDENSAGAIMQTELFSAKLSERISDSIKRLKRMVSDEELSNIHFVFVVDEQNKLKAMLSLEELIMLDLDKTYEESVTLLDEPIFVYSHDSIETVTQTVERYDLAAIAVVDNFRRLLGRITSDDIYDLIEEQATDQIYSLAQVGEDTETYDGVIKNGWARAKWLFLNLGTAALSATVIGLFSNSIEQIVALAVLMPIVASMGGVSGTQTLTVTVRKLALGEVKLTDARSVIGREVAIALFNGAIFAVCAGALAWAWFKTPLLGVAIALALLSNMLYAGFFGAGIPLILKRFGIDPAVASGVLLTTITDGAGFFTFLGLATLILL